MIDCLTETECLWGYWWMPVVHEDQNSITLYCSCTRKYCIQTLILSNQQFSIYTVKLMFDYVILIFNLNV